MGSKETDRSSSLVITGTLDFVQSVRAGPRVVSLKPPKATHLLKTSTYDIEKGSPSKSWSSSCQIAVAIERRDNGSDLIEPVSKSIGSPVSVIGDCP